MVRSVVPALRGRWLWVLLSSAGFEALMLTRPGSTRSVVLENHVLLVLAGLVAGLTAVRRGLADGEQGWAWLGAGCLLFAAGQVAFGLRSLVEDVERPPGNTVSDWITGLAIPCVVVGLISFGGPSLTSRVVTFLDGGTVAVALLFVSWAVVLGPVYRTDSAPTAEVVTTLVYSGGSLGLLALVLVLAMRWRGDTTALALLGVAFAWIAVSNVAYAVTNLRRTYRTGDWRIDVGWFVPLLLIAMAATRTPGPPREDLRRRWTLTLFVPYSAVLVVAVTALVRELAGMRFDRMLTATGTIAVGLVLTRQVVTLRDHHTLTLDLERRVRERTAAARSSDAHLRALLRDSSDVIAVVDDQGRFTYVSPASWSLLGLAGDELVGRPLLDLVHPDDQAATQEVLDATWAEQAGVRTVTLRLSCRDGAWCDAEAGVSRVTDDPLGTGVVLNIRDITDRVAWQKELRQQALIDPLTSLPNRRVFDDRVRHALDRAERTDEAVSVLFVDLDHFKRVNDTAGHAVGDELLVQVAHRLRGCLRPSDTAARLGGDEFAVLLEGTSESQAKEVAARVVAALAPRYTVSGRPLTVTASVGVTTTEAGAATVPDLMRDADVAMYKAKAGGRAQVAVFDSGMHAEQREQHELETGLRWAVEREQLRVRYQPVVDLATGTVTAVEALMRWEVVPGEEATPSQFLPLAEARGLVHRLDRWVLREACAQVRAWQRDLPQHAQLRAHVNLAPAELREPRIVEEVAQALAETGLAPGSLVLELTESAVLGDLDMATEVLARLRALGVRVWLDDFGTGYASLATLQRLPLDGMKVDPSFVAGLESGPRGRRLVGALMHMAQALGLKTVAEAVETPRQEKYLRRMGCEAAQGHLYAPALRADEVTALLSDGAPSLLSSGGVAPRPATADGS